MLNTIQICNPSPSLESNNALSVPPGLVSMHVVSPFYIFLLIIEINNVKESPVIILDAASFTSVRVQPLVLSRDLIGPGYLAASYL